MPNGGEVTLLSHRAARMDGLTVRSATWMEVHESERGWLTFVDLDLEANGQRDHRQCDDHAPCTYEGYRIDVVSYGPTQVRLRLSRP